MFSTKPVNSLRRLFAGYHEPLPISKQQSQKLLDGLKTSFRDQLDREYGPITATTKSHDAGQNRASSSSSSRPRRPAASVHLKSILSNPLFSYNNNHSNIINSGDASSPSALSSAMALPQRDPMDVFEHAVSRGMMTLQAATGCLVAKQQRQQQQQQQLSLDDTALRVVRWLRSSGEANQLKFLDDQPFVRALAPFLVNEKMDAVAWEWITAAMRDTEIPASPRTGGAVAAAAGTAAGTLGHSEPDPRSRRAAFLLSQLVRIKSQSRYGNLDAAIQIILHAERLFPHHPLLPRLLTQSWRSVSWLSTVESYSRTAPSEDLFDAHMAVAERLPRPFTVEKAHLHLHHPTHPDHGPALRFFRDRDTLRMLTVLASGGGSGDGSPDRPDRPVVAGKGGKAMGVIPWITFLGQDTVNHLKQSGRNQEAQGVTDFLRSELSGIFSANLSPT